MHGNPNKCTHERAHNIAGTTTAERGRCGREGLGDRTHLDGGTGHTAVFMLAQPRFTTPNLYQSLRVNFTSRTMCTHRCRTYVRPCACVCTSLHGCYGKCPSHSSNYVSTHLMPTVPTPMRYKHQTGERSRRSHRTQRPTLRGNQPVPGNPWRNGGLSACVANRLRVSKHINTYYAHISGYDGKGRHCTLQRIRILMNSFHQFGSA